jgi:phosphoglycolate phosphatase
MAKPPSELKAVIFDFDGTLATGRYDFQAMRDRVYGLAEAHGVGKDSLHGLYVLEAVEEAANRIASSGGDAARFRAEAESIILDIEMRGARESELLPGIPQSMAALRQHGYRLAVVTRNSRRVVEVIPGATALACDAFLTREAVARVKPHPEHLLAALNALACAATDAAMVGDHPMDIAAGRAAGTATIGVLTGAGTRDTLTEAGADIVVASVVDVAEMLTDGRRAPCGRDSG